MAVHVFRYQEGDTVSCIYWGYVYDADADTKTLTDSDASYPTITITDSAGTEKVSAAAMTKTSTGKYVYYYTIPTTGPTGWWSVKVNNQITSGAVVRSEVSHGGFSVD